ncbi:MAG: hypothetical protein WC505_04625 [Patescibacteria group bacterium]
MSDDTTSDNSLPEGFLLKDKAGKLKKVLDGQLVDFQVAPREEQPAPQSSVPPVPPHPASTASLPAGFSREPRAVSQTIPAEPKVESRLPRPALAPSAPISSSSKAPFLIEPEDEEEIKRHVKGLERMAPREEKPAGSSAQAIIDEIQRECGISFASEVMSTRFKKVVESRLRELRTAIEAREVLMRPSKVGGLELPAEKADAVVSAVNQKIGRGRPEGGTTQHDAMLGMAGQLLEQPQQQAEDQRTVPSSAAGTMVQAPPPFIPLPKRAPEPIEKIEPQPAPPLSTGMVQFTPQEPTATPQPAPAQEQPRPQNIPTEVAPSPRGVDEAVRAPRSVSAATAKLYREPSDGMPRRVPIADEDDRPKLVDIKELRKVIGPVEELGEIDLKEFRRLGTNPEEAAAKIAEKIDLLEEESWQQRSEGISAWKQSPLFLRYVSLGQESLTGGITLDEVIQKHVAGGGLNLQKEEFIAINELNSRLGT